MTSRLIRMVVLAVGLMGMGTGCSLLKLPFTVLEGLLSIASKLPKPPPGVFF